MNVRVSPMRPPRFSLERESRGHLVLRARSGAVAHLFVLEEDILRVLVIPPGRRDLPRTWAIAPGADDGPIVGRRRSDLTGFSTPKFLRRENADRLVVATKRIHLTIERTGLLCTWAMRAGKSRWLDAARDRPTRAYNFGWWDDRVYHYLARDPTEKYFGLGEHSGDLDLTGRRLVLSASDALGYNAKSSDPLYKHLPFYLTWRPSTNLAFGIFYDTLSNCAFDFGCELSAYHGPFRSFIADHGVLDYYVIAGPSVAEVVRRFTWLTGRPAFLPKWSLGYSASGMSYSEAPDAQEQMYKFLDRCARHDVPCDSFHLSSGYTSVGAKRYLFHWNHAKFPDPGRLSSAFLQRGVRLCANLKPWLLRDHPRIGEARRLGLLIRETDKSPAWAQVWGGEGAYLDFTSRRTLRWWKEQVRTALLKRGIAATWNDNNEYEIKSRGARIEGFGHPRAAIEARPLQALLMTRASRDAQREFAPLRRPFVVTRSGGAGVQRYAQTWSGDNYTSWETLKYNLRMGLSLALCGVSNTGHDVGGFAGPKPDPELFLRWVQFGIFMPRFSIHSWNDDGTVNEPWMFPQITNQIRDLIRFRYRLLPYFYDLLWRYHRCFEPMVRPMFYDFPHDLRCYEESEQMMVGSALLAAPAVEPGIKSRPVYLPEGAHWYDFWNGRRLAGGQIVRLAAGRRHPPLLARAGSLVAANLARQSFDSRDDRRGFYLFPPGGNGSFTATSFEDDGESYAYEDGSFCQWCFDVRCSAKTIRVRVSRKGRLARRWGNLPRLLLPRTESRAVIYRFA
jgi:alpha-glucosidase